MNEDFFAYLQQIELLAFFSGYPLIYAIVFFISGTERMKNKLNGIFISLLPYAYALVGTCYLGIQIINVYPDFSVSHIKEFIQLPYLMLWGILSILFWIPALGRQKWLSLMHSLVYIFFIIKDFVLSTDKEVLRNDMNIYSVSLLINIGSFAIILLIYFLFSKSKNKPGSPESSNISSENPAL